jgi:hypothetical protein
MWALRAEDGDAAYAAPLRAAPETAPAGPPGPVLAAHSAAARRALARVLDRRGFDGARADARAVRVDGRVHVTLLTDWPLARPVASAAAVRTVAAVRAVDPDAAVIDVSWSRAGGRR